MRSSPPSKVPRAGSVALLLVVPLLACGGSASWSVSASEQARQEAARVAAGGGDPNARVAEGKPALFAAVEARDCASAEKLLVAGADTSMDWHGWTPLQTASHGNGACADVLLAHGADPNQRVRGAPPLYLAAQRGDGETVRALLAHGASVDAGYQHRFPIQVAAQQGDADAVEALLAGGANPNTRGSSGENPLHLAAVRGHEEAAAVLLEAGARLTEIPSDPWTTARTFEWAARYQEARGEADRAAHLRRIACEYFPQAVTALERQDDGNDEAVAYAEEATAACKERAGERGLPPPFWKPGPAPL